MRKTIISALIGAGILLTPLAVEAVGLGRLTVKSGLGQPFNGEIELLSVDRYEEGTISARLASTDIYQQARVERSLSLTSLRFAVEQRKGGDWYIKVNSNQPINDPFLDVLVELNWPSGRLLREFTVLLDPPSAATEQQQVAAVELPAVKSPPPETTAPPVEKAIAPPPLKVEKILSEKKAPKVPAPAKAESANTYGPVKQGETLSKIAAAVKPETVSMEQMLIALYRANQQAFSGNINRLKTGQILQVPDATQAGSVDHADALKEVRAQAADWNAYRNKLAGIVENIKPAREDEGRKSSGGKITSAVEDKGAQKEPAKDVLKLSKSETSSAPGKAGVSQDELIAKEKALKEANTRIAELEKNIQDMRKLLELRSQGMADLQKQPAKPAPAKPAEEKKPEPKPVEEKKPEPTPEPPKPAQAQPTPAPVSAPAVTGEEAQPKPKPKVVTLEPPPTAQVSVLDELLGNPLMLGGAALIAMLGGLLGYRKVKARREQAGDSLKKGNRVPVPFDEPPPNTAPMADLTPAVSSVLTDFTQSGMGAIDTADVDPIAEAEVYMAYGRDVQAEEILREAMARDPQRHEIHLKLLEIYAARKDHGSFEALARQLYAATGGSPDPDWEKAAEMGRALDPANSLYVAVAAAAVAAAAEEILDLGGPAETLDASPDLDFNLEAGMEPSAALDVPLDAPASEPAVEELAADLDFNLGQPEEVAPTPAPAAEEDGNLLDFNLDMPAMEPAAPEPAKEEEANLVDFDLGDSLSAPEAPAEEPAPAEEAMLSFDLDMPLGEAEPAAPAEPAPAADELSAESWASQTDELASLDLPVDQPEAPALPVEAEQPAPAEEASLGDEAMLDLSAFMAEEPAPAEPTPPAEAPLELPMAGEAVEESIEITPPAMSDEAMLDFDFNVGEEPAAPPAEQAPNIDLSDISLDLDGAAKQEAPAQDYSARYQEAATKLDLAKAYMEMGDKEGAKEILGEVLNEGSDDQQDEAKKLLADLH